MWILRLSIVKSLYPPGYFGGFWDLQRKCKTREYSDTFILIDILDVFMLSVNTAVGFHVEFVIANRLVCQSSFVSLVTSCLMLSRLRVHSKAHTGSGASSCAQGACVRVSGLAQSSREHILNRKIIQHYGENYMRLGGYFRSYRNWGTTVRGTFLKIW